MDTSTSKTTIRHALVVHAHPEPRSFSTAQATAAQRALQSQGVQTKMLDLYAEGWDPVLAREQFASVGDYFKPQSAQMVAVAGDVLEEPVRSHLALVHEADLLILSFPLWWFSVPAILKGWMDRVLVMGSVFGGQHGIFERGAMRGKKAMALLTTGGAEAAFVEGSPDGYGSLDSFLFHIHRGVFEFCGYEALAPVVTFAPAHLDAGARTTALEAAGRRVTAALHS